MSAAAPGWAEPIDAGKVAAATMGGEDGPEAGDDVPPLDDGRQRHVLQIPEHSQQGSRSLDFFGRQRNCGPRDYLVRIVERVINCLNAGRRSGYQCIGGWWCIGRALFEHCHRFVNDFSSCRNVGGRVVILHRAEIWVQQLSLITSMPIGLGGV